MTELGTQSLGTQFSLRLPDDIAVGLALLAERRGRLRAEEAREAIRLHVARALTDERPGGSRAELEHHADQDGEDAATRV